MVEGKVSGVAALALTGVGAVCVGVMFVTDVPEPMDVIFVGEESDPKSVDGSISPSLVVESACLVEILNPLGVSFTPVEIHVCDLEIGPEMAGGVAASKLVLDWILHILHQEVDGCVFVEVILVLVEELQRFRPQVLHRLLCIIQTDDESVDLVVHLHELEDVVVDVAEVVCVRFEPPVVLELSHSRVVEKVDAVIPAHVVVGDLVCICDVLLLQDLHFLLLLFCVDPVGLVPDLRLDLFEIDLRGGHGGHSFDEVWLEVAVV